MARKVGRPKAGQERLTRERILSAALGLIDQEGMGALSMRRLAAELDVDPMAIYHHLPGKEALLAAIVEDVFAGLRVPSIEDARWQDRVHAFAQAFRDVVRSHPNLARYLVTDAGAAASGTLEATEALYAALEAAGLPPLMIVRAADLIVDYINGFALAEAAGPLEQPEDRQQLMEQLHTRPADAFPVMRRIFGSLREDEFRADFGFGLDVILAGLEPLTRRADV